MGCSSPRPVPRTECHWWWNWASRWTCWWRHLFSVSFSSRFARPLTASISPTWKNSRMIDLQLMALLLTPLLGGLLLAVFGSRSWAAELNSLMSFCTFIAAVVLTMRVIDSGPQVAFNEQFFIDQFNVFLVALTAFVAFTTSLFSRPYMRIEQHHGKLSTQMLHRSEEHTSELQSPCNLVCRLLL